MINASIVPLSSPKLTKLNRYGYCGIDAGDRPPQSTLFFFSTLGSMIRPEFSSPSILPLALLDLANSLTKC